MGDCARTRLVAVRLSPAEYAALGRLMAQHEDETAAAAVRRALRHAARALPPDLASPDDVPVRAQGEG